MNIRDDWGFVGRFDLAVREYGLLIEYDGDYHRTDREKWYQDSERTRRIQAMGLRLLRVDAGAMRNPRSLLRQVDAHLRLGGYRGPGPRQTARWVECFG